VYSPDQLDAARACYERLETKAPPRIENAATRLSERFTCAWEERDWERIAAAFAPECRETDRRKMVRVELDRDRELESLRFLFEIGSSRFVEEVLATRGDRLALFRGRVVGTGSDTGPSEVDFLQVTETDDRGDAVAIVTFDPDDLDAAYAELDDRYAAGEAAAYARNWETYRRVGPATDARDWEQLASVFDRDFVMEDHRPLGLLPRSCDEYVASVRALLD